MCRTFMVGCHIENLDPPAKEGAVHSQWLVAAESAENAIAQVRNRIDVKYIANFTATGFDSRAYIAQLEQELSKAPPEVVQELQRKIAVLERKEAKQ